MKNVFIRNNLFFTFVWYKSNDKDRFKNDLILIMTSIFPMDVVYNILSMLDYGTAMRILEGSIEMHKYDYIYQMTAGHKINVGRYDKALNVITMDKQIPKICCTEYCICTDFLWSCDMIEKVYPLAFTNILMSCMHEKFQLFQPIYRSIVLYGICRSAFLSMLGEIEMQTTDILGEAMQSRGYRELELSVCYEYKALDTIIFDALHGMLGTLYIIVKQDDKKPTLRFVEHEDSIQTSSHAYVRNDVLVNMLSFVEYKKSLIMQIKKYIV